MIMSLFWSRDVWRVLQPISFIFTEPCRKAALVGKKPIQEQWFSQDIQDSYEEMGENNDVMNWKMYGTY